jgi:hypothetical protein
MLLVEGAAKRNKTNNTEREREKEGNFVLRFAPFLLFFFFALCCALSLSFACAARLARPSVLSFSLGLTPVDSPPEPTPNLNLRRRRRP